MTIIFVGGGTLGHLYPALPVIKAWKKAHPGTRIVFFTTSKPTEHAVVTRTKEIDQGYYFDNVGLNRKSLFSNFKLIKLIPKVRKEIKAALRKENPKLVVGMGGYISGLAIMAAQKLKIPTIIHEGNSVMGLANRLVYKKCAYFLCGFDNRYKHPHKLVIGNPRQDEATNFAKEHENENTQISNNNLLIVSGTLGAKVINQVAIEFLQSEKSQTYHTTLITGKRYYEEVVKRIGNATSDHYHIVPFSDNLLQALLKTSVVISRAGSTTLAEIIGMQKLSIIIPSPNVSHNHQVKNALSLEKKKAVLVLLEKDLNLSTLINALNKIFEQNIQNELKTGLAQLHDIHPTHKFIDVMEQVIR